MDNKKISIDDLFRKIPGDREGAPPPGAWSRMEGLLDAKMPVGVPPIAARRPSRGWAFLLLGLVVAGSGTFIYHSATKGDYSAQKTLAESTTSLGQTTDFGTRAAEKQAVAQLPNTAAEQPVLQKKIPVGSKSVTASGNQPIQNIQQPLTSGNPVVAKVEKAARGKADVQTTLGQTETLKETAPALPVVLPANAEISGNNRPATVWEDIAPLPAVASRITDFFAGKIVNPTNAARVEAHLLQWASGQNHLEHNWSAKIPVGAAMAAGAPQKAVASASPAFLETAGGAAAAARPEGEGAAVTPVAAVQTPAQKIENAIEDLRQARFAVALFAGINSTLSIGSGALQGLHAGIMGLVALSEKWSLGAELRYAFRLNNSMDLKDDYFSGKAVSEAALTRNGKLYNAVRYDIDSTLSRYSFTSYQSLSLPLQVRYNQGRFAVYGGPTLAFHFAPSVTRTDTRIGTISRYDTVDAALPLRVLPSRAAENAISDFDSRMSIGYNVGAQYRITPALHLDLRLAQQVWDSRQSHSAGARRVSETYIQIPSVQLSVGYFFKEKAARESPAKP